MSCVCSGATYIPRLRIASACLPSPQLDGAHARPQHAGTVLSRVALIDSTRYRTSRCQNVTRGMTSEDPKTAKKRRRTVQALSRPLSGLNDAFCLLNETVIEDVNVNVSAIGSDM